MFYKLISTVLLLPTLLFSFVTLETGFISSGDGIYDEGEFYEDDNGNGIWDDGEAVYDDWVEIIYTTEVNIRGFQFDIQGIDMIAGIGGDLDVYGFDLYASGDTALGFSLEGNTIPALSSGLLSIVYGTISDEDAICFPFVQGVGPEDDTPIFADENGDAIQGVTIGSGYECDAMFNNDIITFNLFEAYPNPFNPDLNISIKINENSYTNVTVYDINGRLLETIYSGMLISNNVYDFKWNAKDFSSGIYIINVDSDNFVQSKIINLIK